jgi:hypothetical protein
MLVSLTHQLPSTLKKLVYVRGLVDPKAIVRLERLGQLKNSIASSGIKLATVRLNK